MRPLRFLLILIGLACTGTSVAAQQSPSDTVARSDSVSLIPAPPTDLWRECDPGLDLVRSELLGLDRHAGWGMLLGATAGVGYALVTSKGLERPLLVLADSFLGGGIGLTVGSGVYLVRRASGYRPPIRTSCSSNRR